MELVVLAQSTNNTFLLTDKKLIEDVDKFSLMKDNNSLVVILDLKTRENKFFVGNSNKFATYYQFEEVDLEKSTQYLNLIRKYTSNEEFFEKIVESIESLNSNE